MQVPAYCPVEAGVQASENNGVVVEVVKTMVIVMAEEDDMSIAIAEL